MRRFVPFAAAVLLLLTPAFAPAQYYRGDPSALVDSWYRTYLGHPADSGITYWVNHLQQGDSPDSVIAGILASDEYYKKCGGTPDGFIAGLFKDLLQRRPTTSELDFWVRRLYTQDRQDLAHDLMTQNPGTWVGSSATVQPVVPFVTTAPRIVIEPQYRWDRDRHEDWDQHHEIHDYRRPIYPYRRDDHRDDHRR
jgi:hypothetical protein